MKLKIVMTATVGGAAKIVRHHGARERVKNIGDFASNAGKIAHAFMEKMSSAMTQVVRK